MIKNCPTEYRQELRERILKTATQEFKTKGIKAVKMDDIANLLSVSKRTVYEIYENKEQLLMETVKMEQRKTEQHMREFASRENVNVMDIILEFYRLKMSSLNSFNPAYFEELNRYPEVAQWIREKHNESENEAQLFFQQGTKEGFFREDVNYELISKFGSGTMNYIMSNEMYKHYEFKELFRNLAMLFVRGFCTAKGIDELERQMQKMK